MDFKATCPDVMSPKAMGNEPHIHKFEAPATAQHTRDGEERIKVRVSSAWAMKKMR